MHLSTLTDWLHRIKSIHVTEMDLGLDRVQQVADKLQLLSPTCAVIIVGGTNGKGSTVAGLDTIYRTANYRVGTFTSPVLFSHNEQAKINGTEASDADFCEAFEKIESARGKITLTPFEFHTLAALIIFQQAKLDVMILEVGLGGRLDATNIINANVTIVTSIDLDHMQLLGSTREAIAHEKAGIFRANTPAICGDPHPPHTLLNDARRLATHWFQQGKDFHYEKKESDWDWFTQTVHYSHLPFTSLALQNMSSVLMAITCLQTKLPVTLDEIKQGLKTIHLPGRIQIVPGKVTTIYDVAHNPAAITWLATKLKELPHRGKTYAVFSMLADKDIIASIEKIADVIDTWFIAPLHTDRGATLTTLQHAFQQTPVRGEIIFFDTIIDAYRAATAQAISGDCIAVFGSFSVLTTLKARAHNST